MSRRLGRLLNASLLLMTLLSDRCAAQAVPSVTQQAAAVWSPDKSGWLRTLGSGNRYLLLGPNEPSGFRQQPRAAKSDEIHSSPFSAAMKNAWKKGVVERAVEGYTEVLIQCQKEQYPALTTPFMRSDSQQAHCFRF